MTPAERQRRRSAKRRAERLAALKALPPVSDWFGLQIVSLEAVLALSQPAEKS